MDESVRSYEARRGSDNIPLGDELRGERATLGKSLLDVQRDLRVKAAYIAAIEDAELDVFPNPAFVPGYVRSYARYLNLDADEVYARFCRESGFAGGAASRGADAARQAPTTQHPAGFRPDFPLMRANRWARPAVPLSAIGSLLILVALLAGLGYGGWTILQNIQRVQFAPVEEVPMAAVEVDALEAPPGGSADEPGLAELASPVAAMSLADLYRQQELDVPILVPRDGPIAAIDPDAAGLLAQRGGSRSGPQELPGLLDTTVATLLPTAAPLDAAAEAEANPAAKRREIAILAERAAWIRVYLEDGSVIFERILEPGESYVPPESLEAPMVWAGNSGSVYVKVGDSLRGPLGSGTRAVRDIALDPGALEERYAAVTDVPDTLTDSIGGAPGVVEAAAVR